MEQGVGVFCGHVGAECAIDQECSTVAQILCVDLCGAFNSKSTSVGHIAHVDIVGWVGGFKCGIGYDQVAQGNVLSTIDVECA